MKKLVFMFAAVAAISFASCGNKTAETAEVADSDTVAAVVEDTTATEDTTAVSEDTTATEEAAPVEEAAPAEGAQ